MTTPNILVVEDQPKYREAAKLGLAGKPLVFATNYEEAMREIAGAGQVITDIFFPESQRGNSHEIQTRAVEQIRKGMISRDMADYVESIRAASGITPNARLIKSLETICHSQVGIEKKEVVHNGMKQVILIYVKTFKEEAAEKLESAVTDMGIHLFTERIVESRINPLKNYMTQAQENQPLGYLVAEEAERLGKPFVLVTSLRHSEGALVPIILSTQSRGWNLMEWTDGSKENPEYWEKAYKKLGGNNK